MDRSAKIKKNLDHNEDAGEVRRAAWEPPTLVELPPLTELTLQTGDPIGGGGGTGGGGSTVF
jgi:hypothetical protein